GRADRSPATGGQRTAQRVAAVDRRRAGVGDGAGPYAARRRRSAHGRLSCCIYPWSNTIRGPRAVQHVEDLFMTMIAELDTEISRLQQETSAVERAPQSFDEVWPAVEAQLAEAEATFRRLGPQLGGFVSQLPEHVEERRRAMVGMAV